MVENILLKKLTFQRPPGEIIDWPTSNTTPPTHWHSLSSSTTPYLPLFYYYSILYLPPLPLTRSTIQSARDSCPILQSTTPPTLSAPISGTDPATALLAVPPPRDYYTSEDSSSASSSPPSSSSSTVATSGSRKSGAAAAAAAETEKLRQSLQQNL